MDNSLVRIIAFIVAAVLIVWQVKKRWQLAGEISNADEEAMKTWKMGFQSFKQQPSFQSLKKYIDEKYPNTFDKPVDASTYQIVYITPMDEKGQTFPFEEITRAKSLVAYLKNGQRNLQIALDLQTNQIYENELGNTAFNSMVPYWAGK